MSAVFIETLNLSNGTDRAKARSQGFRRRMARGIADGITDCLTP